VLRGALGEGGRTLAIAELCVLVCVLMCVLLCVLLYVLAARGVQVRGEGGAQEGGLGGVRTARVRQGGGRARV
jgi:hypothetical protein